MLKPYVTGISPKEGYPGTKVIIRGENLGKDESDLIAVKICNVDCTLRSKWEKESRITTYTGFCIGKGDIVVVTRSGGSGTSSVGFQGLVKKNIGPNEESCIWIEEDTRAILTGLKRSAVADLLHDNPLGISVDESRFDDLRSGLNHMKDKIGSKTISSSDNLLKNNISSFMDAIKIMKDIYALSSIDKKNDFSNSLQRMLNDILKTAHKIYDQDLASKDRADMIRNSLQILDTYKSLIYFPQNVDKYLKDDDYEQIITSYKLAMLQLSKAESSTRKSSFFEQIKTDLDTKIFDVQKHILARLTQFPSNPDDQKYLIDYYNIIEALHIANNKKTPLPNVSPAWYCLEEEKKWLVQLMIECRDMHIADEKVSLALKQSDSNEQSSSSSSSNKKDPNSAGVDQSAQQQQQSKPDESGDLEKRIKNNLNVKSSTILSAADAAKIQAMTPIPQERNKFIEELCQIFFDVFSDYWRLGTMYFSNMLTLPNVDNLKSNKLHKQLMHTPDEFYTLVSDILVTFSDIVRAAFIPHTFKSNGNGGGNGSQANLFLPWPIKHDEKIISQILPHCLRVCRMCSLQINSLEIPPQLFETIQTLIYNLRCECLKNLLSTPTREILSNLGFEEQDWIIDRDIDNDNNCYLITNLPIRFEAKITKALALSKEFVLDDRKGERALFRETDFIGTIAKLIYAIIHAFLKRISRFMTKEDPLPKFVQLSRGKLLIYLFNNLALAKRKILPNVWNIIAQHKYKFTEQIVKESKKMVKELQDDLLRKYMEEAIGPIVDSIEENLYAGKYDFSDSSSPSTVRNYVKQIMMSLLNVHSELFLLNKSLIQTVFTYAIREIYAKLYSLFTNVPQFGQQAAIQTYVDIFCLRETFKQYANDESKELMQQIIKLIPTSSFESNKSLMTKLINDFQKGMQPYIAVFQQPPPPAQADLPLLKDEKRVQL